MDEPADHALVRIVALTKTFPGRGDQAPVHALTGVDLEIRRGETLGLGGDSGSGKSTLARMLVGLATPTSGQIFVGGSRVDALAGRAWRRVRRGVQMVFQDPAGSLNPRMTIGTALRRPLAIHGLATGAEADVRIRTLLERVGLRAEHADRYPHELSGGQQQRIGIARALVVEPALTVLDEPTSALDVSVQAQILALLRSLQSELHLTYLFISHDLSVIRHLSDRIAVMYRGRLLEIGPAPRIAALPRHPYTRMLLGAIPKFYGRAVDTPPVTVAAEVPEATGCPYYGRCARRLPQCRTEFPSLAPATAEHRTACFNPHVERSFQ